MNTAIKAILIANRGEIAERIIRTCRKMGIVSVAVFSDADEMAPFVHQSDRSVGLGGNSPADTYLNMAKILEAAHIAQVDAIHPGYGFLAENAEFCRRCLEEGFIFIGPQPEAIEQMGSKAISRSLMKAAGVPVVPGYEGKDQSIVGLTGEAQKIGFPVLLKAAAGGGGKGMRIVQEAGKMSESIAAAQREAQSAFGDSRLVIEKYFESVRHVEFQIFGDQQGNIVHIFERECSVQRRFQKIIEECPSPAMTPELRAEMGEAAIRAAQTIQYQNAGTVEFLLTQEGKFYFLEMNTRLQVEHPVTEMVTGLDLVKLQIKVAEGKPLSFRQEDIKMSGHAVECRLYAENPGNQFLPETGRIRLWATEDLPNLRYDSGVQTGSEIGVHYDPMIAKVIAFGTDRNSALRRLEYAIRNLRCLGVRTNQKFLADLMSNPVFKSGKFDTHFIPKHINLGKYAVLDKEAGQVASIAAMLYRWSLRQAEKSMLAGVPSGWRNSYYKDQVEEFQSNGDVIRVLYRYDSDKFLVQIGDFGPEVKLKRVHDGRISFSVNGFGEKAWIASEGDEIFVHTPSYGQVVLKIAPRFPETEAEENAAGYTAKMPGEVVRVEVRAGDRVKAGQVLLVLSSMKMENAMEAAEEGVIGEVYVKVGDFVEAGQELVEFV